MDADKPQPIRGYRHNRELAIICALWAVLIFFRLDGLIGAVGLRQHYPSMIHFFIVSCVAIFWTLLALWNVLRVEIAAFLGIVCALLFIVLGSSIMKVLASDSGDNSGAWFFVAGFIISLMVLLLEVYKPGFFAPLLLKILTFYTLFYAIIALIGAGAYSSGSTFQESLSFQVHHYFLVDQRSGSSDRPDAIRLYECNQLAFACRNVYETDYATVPYNRIVVLVPNANLGSIDLFSDNVLLYRHTPSS